MIKRTTRKGFTIIEVVITIAIGAAVMALVLNAVAGARRSQRNNARTADVNQVAAAYNQYIATRNSLPEHFGQLSDIVGSGLGHYTPDRINAANSWTSSSPTPNAPAFCSSSTYTTQTSCENGPDGIAHGASGDMGDAETWTPASAVGKFDWNNDYATIPATPVKLSKASDPEAADYILVLNQAKCQSGNIQPISGGIREGAIIYRLEGQNDTVCLEI